MKTLTVNTSMDSKRTYNNLLKQHDVKLIEINDNRIELQNDNDLLLSHIISNSMIDDLYERESFLYLNKHYSDLPRNDKLRVVEIAKNKKNSQKELGVSFLRKELREYIKEFDELNIDGFFKFRAQDCKNLIHKKSEDALDSFLVEKEYETFISALQKFILTHEPLEEEVHVEISLEENKTFYNKDHDDITQKILREWKSREIKEIMTPDDIFISALITLAPRKLYIRGLDNIKNKELIGTIKKIWKDRLIEY